MNDNNTPSNFKLNIKQYCKDCDSFEPIDSCTYYIEDNKYIYKHLISCKYQDDCKKKLEYLLNQISKEALC